MFRCSAWSDGSANSCDGLQVAKPNRSRVTVVTIFEPLADGLIDHVGVIIDVHDVPTGCFQDGNDPSFPYAVFDLVTHANDSQDFSSPGTLEKSKGSDGIEANRQKMVKGFKTINKVLG